MSRKTRALFLVLCSLLGTMAALSVNTSPAYAEKCKQKGCNTDTNSCINTDALANCTGGGTTDCASSWCP